MKFHKKNVDLTVFKCLPVSDLESLLFLPTGIGCEVEVGTQIPLLEHSM